MIIDVNISRSSTMPLNSDGEASEGSPQGSTPSMFGSISSLAASSGMKDRLLGIRRGKDLLTSAWSNLSPQTSKMGTRQALTSLRSGLTSAATNLSKRYEEMTTAAAGQSPAPPELSETTDQDRVSQCSNDSRRQSETVQVDGIPQGKLLTNF